MHSLAEIISELPIKLELILFVCEIFTFPKYITSIMFFFFQSNKLQSPSYALIVEVFSDRTELIHGEAIRCLIALFSCQLYRENVDQSSIISSFFLTGSW